MGRDIKLTDDLALKIAESLEAGNSIDDACAAVGITDRTFHNWIQRGEAGEEPFLQFFRLTRAARARANGEYVTAIKKAAPEDWRAAGFLLERRDPKNWGRTDKVKTEHTGADGQPLGADKEAMLAVVLRALEAYPEAKHAVGAAIRSMKKERVALGVGSDVRANGHIERFSRNGSNEEDQGDASRPGS